MNSNSNKINIEAYNNYFILKISLTEYSIPTIYIILFSYLKNAQIQVYKILSVNYQYVRPMFRDVTFIKELHYLDFKL
jgi:hypothetical protein